MLPVIYKILCYAHNMTGETSHDEGIEPAVDLPPQEIVQSAPGLAKVNEGVRGEISKDMAEAMSVISEKDVTLPEDMHGEARAEAVTRDRDGKPELETAEGLGAYAQKVSSDFRASRNRYLKEREQLFGSSESTTVPKTIKVAAKITRNFTRWIEDRERRAQSRATPGELKLAHVTVRVATRDAFFEDPYFQNLLQGESNRGVIQSMLDEEIYKEVNCTRWLAIEGLDTDELHLLMRMSGHNPTAFLSDDRRENAGRIVIDNALENGRHPVIDATSPLYEKEVKYWRPVFPNAPKFLPVSGWMMSRTHSVVYSVKSADGREALLLPVHVDPKNAVAFFGEVFGKKDTDERGALDYHSIEEVKGGEYVGTGLYELGCKYTIEQLKRMKERGYIRELSILDEDRLTTTGTVVGDEALSQKTANNLRLIKENLTPKLHYLFGCPNSLCIIFMNNLLWQSRYSPSNSCFFIYCTNSCISAEYYICLLYKGGELK